MTSSARAWRVTPVKLVVFWLRLGRQGSYKSLTIHGTETFTYKMVGPSKAIPNNTFSFDKDGQMLENILVLQFVTF